jgi:hypothetical protein
MVLSAPPDLIGFCGRAGAGKSTAAAVLVARHHYRLNNFAGPLKAGLRAVLAATGLAPDEIERMVAGDLKEAPHPALMGASPRHAMQTLGTEWGRACIDVDFWAAAGLAQAIAGFVAGEARQCFDDVRFANEAAAIRSAGGVIVEITGRGGIAGGHASEAMDFSPDFSIENNAGPEALEAKLLPALGFA